MLIKCPECQLQVSDRAIACPHCGFPISKDSSGRTRSSKSRRRRLPNGFGVITKLNNKQLRKPYRARIYAGKDENGRPINRNLKPIAYFETYNEAYEALAEYNRNPYDLSDVLTVKELYERWSEQYFKKLKSPSSVRTITAAWSHCASLHNILVIQLRPRHIKMCMDEVTSANIKSRIKSLFNLMLDYAVEYELVDKNCARSFNVSDDIRNEIEEETKSHMSFTDGEMSLLWKNINIPYVDVILFQCYTGFRPQEIGLIELDKVDSEGGFIIGGMKTEAGTDRTVPIHPLIRKIVENHFEEGKRKGAKYLFECSETVGNRRDNRLTYDRYRHRFNRIVAVLGLHPGHRTHDGRKQFITMAKKYNVDEYAIKKIVGHSINDITEKVYTDRNRDWLMQEICKIKNGAV